MGCKRCYFKCPQKCIDIFVQPVVIQNKNCLHCGNCYEICSADAIKKWRNTPIIIKYPFLGYTQANPESIYACVNLGQAYAPKEIAERSICLDADIGQILEILSQGKILWSRG